MSLSNEDRCHHLRQIAEGDQEMGDGFAVTELVQEGLATERTVGSVDVRDLTPAGRRFIEENCPEP